MSERVLRVITRLNVGGPARHALLLSAGLEPDWSTTLVAGTPPPGEGELDDPRVEVQRVPLQRPVAPVADGRALAALARHVRRERPAIVHTHMAKAGTLGRLASWSARPRPRTVHTFHGHVLDGYFSKPVEQAFIASERALARATDALVAVSEQTRDSLLELGIGRPEQWRVIPLGLELDRHLAVDGHSGVLRDELGLDDDALLVGMVGRLVPIKDPATMLRAFARVPDAHLAVVGDGELREQTEALADELGIADRVHHLGWRFDMPAVLADLDLVALSSRNEGTPLTIIEAAACGVPAVATDVGGVAAVVRHGETGLLVPAEDPEALAEAIRSLLGDPPRRRQLGQAARVASDRYGAGRLLADVAGLYRELLG